MTQHVAPPAMSLFDLIARSWELDHDIAGLTFNVNGSTVAVQHTDGVLTFLQVKDSEDPETRVRIEGDTGRMTIRPRDKALPVPVRTEGSVAHKDHALWPLAQQGFAFVHHDGGALWRATAKGQVLRIAKAGDAPVSALAALPGKRGLIAARGAQLETVSPEDATSLGMVTLSHQVQRIAVSPDAEHIACWGEDRVSILVLDQLTPVATVEAKGPLLNLRWSPDGHWLVGGCADKALRLVDIGAETADRIVDFPSPVASVAFSEKAGAMISSGAFRVVGWHLPDLPFGDHAGTPIETGRPGLTVVERVAVHPGRNLCAAGYANGLVTICQIGTREEMMLREGRGDPVVALEWSPDGRHLAIGTARDQARGTASIVTFPKVMFK